MGLKQINNWIKRKQIYTSPLRILFLYYLHFRFHNSFRQESWYYLHVSVCSASVFMPQACWNPVTCCLPRPFRSLLHPSPSIRPLSPSLYLSVLSLCRCGRTDCCSVTSTALAFQQRRIRWKFHIPLSLSLSGMWHIQFLYTWHWWYSFSLFFSISPSHSVCLSVSQPCLTFPALIGRGKFYRVWRLVWRVRTYRYTSTFIFAFFSIKSIFKTSQNDLRSKIVCKHNILENVLY